MLGAIDLGKIYVDNVHKAEDGRTRSTGTAGRGQMARLALCFVVQESECSWICSEMCATAELGLRAVRLACEHSTRPDCEQPGLGTMNRRGAMYERGVPRSLYPAIRPGSSRKLTVTVADRRRRPVPDRPAPDCGGVRPADEDSATKRPPRRLSGDIISKQCERVGRSWSMGRQARFHVKCGRFGRNCTRPSTD
jgi:hypothetical protein